MINRRQFQRYDCSVPAKVHSRFGSFQCTIADISVGGAGVGATHDHIVQLKKGDAVKLEIIGFGNREIDLMWTGSGKFGARFKRPLTDDEIRKVIGRDL